MLKSVDLPHTEILKIISACEMTLSEKDQISKQFLNLSPAKIGDFLENFCREIHTFEKSQDSSHDALCALGSQIEIKCSRVIGTIESSETDLFNQFLNHQKLLLTFEEAFHHSFDCNIQQVKPELFNDLYYYLIFRDCLLSFKIPGELFLFDKVKSLEAIIAESRTAGIDNEILENISSLSDLTDLSKSLKLLPEKSYSALNEKIQQAQLSDFKLSSLSYSAKQHRGNEGEGQFHIQSRNLQHHLNEYFLLTLL